MRAAQARVAVSSNAPAQARVASSSNEPAPLAGGVPDADKCAAEFRCDLVSRYGHAKLDAIDLCTLAWRATKAGARGVADLAVDPAHQGSNHARVVRKALGLDKVVDEVLFQIWVPKYDASIGRRVVSSMHVKLPHEALARDFQNNRSAYFQARRDDDDIMVPGFVQHPVTMEFGTDACWPCGYYTDKVKLGNESFYRGSVKCTLMRSSITCWVIKCPELCRCGCNGMCTVDAIQMEMNWSLNALQRNTFMESRFDKRPWPPLDKARSIRAGSALGFRGVLNEYRADLPERCAAARVKTQSGYFCCLSCNAKATEVHDHVEEVSLFKVPWQPRTQESYLEELATHLVAVHLSDDAERAAIDASLCWLDDYPWGRRVSGSLGARWGLAAKDQLVVTDVLRNPHDLMLLRTPCTVFFFRPRRESGVSGLSIMFNVPGVPSLGIDHFEVNHLAECTLHTVDLGIAQRFCATSIVKALTCNVYGLRQKSRLARVKRGCFKIRQDMKTYYANWQKRFPHKQLTRLSKAFSYRHLGNLKMPCLKAKGGQTRCLVRFCTELMQKHNCGDDGKLLAQSGQALVDMYDIMEHEPRRMSLNSRRLLVQAAVNHVTLYKAAGGHLVHKHHGVLHMAVDAGRTGNPRHISTYEDESENGVVAKIGLRCHGLTFAKSVFERLELTNPESRVLPFLDC
jgi:hypothetical protein